MQEIQAVLFVIFTLAAIFEVNANCRLSSQELTLTASNGTITTPNYNATYPTNQRCSWKFQADPFSILVLQVIDLQTGDQSIWCGSDYVRLPNGLRICGNSKPKNCYAFASESMMLSRCLLLHMPQCGCNTQIFSLDNWPPTVLFRSNRRMNYKGAAINYTFIKCPQDMMVPNSTIRQEVADTDRTHLTAFTATTIVSGFMLVLIFILMIVIIQEKKRNRALRRRLPNTKATPIGRQAPKDQPPAVPSGTSGSHNTSYINSPTTETGSIHYDYVNPLSDEKNQYENPICHKPVYVELQ